MANDVFISYAHNDNLIEPDEEEGWVTKFQQLLRIFLTGFVGRKAEVWLDEQRMTVGDFLTPSLYKNLDSSTTMVSVISPSYLASEWCSRELNYFWKRAVNQADNHSRLFFVVKLPGDIPREFEDLLRLEFFEVQKDSTPLPFSPAVDDFKKKVGTLAYRISERVKELQVRQKPGKTIYLAETTVDMRAVRKNVRNDLIQQDFSVLPALDDDKPVEADGYQASVREDLAKCDLAVHLIGRNYGDCPPDGDRSYIHLQTLTAAERDQEPNFSRLIWMPEDLDQNPEFMQELLASAKKNVDVFRDPSIENLKTRIQEILAGRTNDQTDVKTDEDGEIIPNVYVFCEKSDAQDARRLENNLFDMKCEIFTSRNLSEEDTDDSFSQHEKFLQKTNGVLIYWKNPLLRNWIQLIVSNLNRKVGYEALGVYLGDNPEERDYYRTHRAQIIKDNVDLTRFVTTLKTKLGGNQHAV